MTTGKTIALTRRTFVGKVMSLLLISHTPAACSFPGEKARSWGALGEARPGQSSLSAAALRYRAWAQSWSSAALAARSVLSHSVMSDSLQPHGL